MGLLKKIKEKKRKEDCVILSITTVLLTIWFWTGSIIYGITTKPIVIGIFIGYLFLTMVILFETYKELKK